MAKEVMGCIRHNNALGAAKLLKRLVVKKQTAQGKHFNEIILTVLPII